MFRKDYGIDLKKEDSGIKIAELIFGDPEAFSQFFYRMCEPQAKAAGVSPDDFALSLTPEALDRAAIAFMESYADFSHRSKGAREEVRKRIPTILANIDREMATMAATMMDKVMIPSTSSGTAGASPG